MPSTLRAVPRPNHHPCRRHPDTTMRGTILQPIVSPRSQVGSAGVYLQEIVPRVSTPAACMMPIRDQGRERPMDKHHFRKTFLPPCLQQVLTLHHTKVPLCLTQNICRTTVQANMSTATQITCQRRLTGYWVPMRMVSVIEKTRGRANGIMCERYPLHASTHRLVLSVYTYHLQVYL